LERPVFFCRISVSNHSLRPALKTLIVATAFMSLLVAGCGTAPTAAVSATGESDGGYMLVRNNKRQETLLGSRLARESRENAESVKAIGRRGYQDSQNEKSGSSLATDH
jgi:hypothetical protein